MIWNYLYKQSLKEMDWSSDGVYKEYQQLIKNVARSKKCLLIVMLTSSYIFVVTTYLAIGSSLVPNIITFKSDASGNVEQIVPYRNPRLTDRQAMNWTRERVIDLLSLHFKKYYEQIRQRKDYFVGDGFIKYQESLIENETIDRIRNDGLIVTAINQKDPRIVRRWIDSGVTKWQMQVPMLQTIEGASDKPYTNRFVALVTIEETQRDEAIDGLKIRYFNILD